MKDKKVESAHLKIHNLHSKHFSNHGGWSLQCISGHEMRVVFVKKTRMGTFVFSLSSLDLPFLKWATIALVG